MDSARLCGRRERRRAHAAAARERAAAAAMAAAERRGRGFCQRVGFCTARKLGNRRNRSGMGLFQKKKKSRWALHGPPFTDILNLAHGLPLAWSRPSHRGAPDTTTLAVSCRVRFGRSGAIPSIHPQRNNCLRKQERGGGSGREFDSDLLLFLLGFACSSASSLPPLAPSSSTTRQTQRLDRRRDRLAMIPNSVFL